MLIRFEDKSGKPIYINSNLVICVRMFIDMDNNSHTVIDFGSPEGGLFVKGTLEETVAKFEGK